MGPQHQVILNPERRRFEGVRHVRCAPLAPFLCTYVSDAAKTHLVTTGVIQIAALSSPRQSASARCVASA